MGIHQQKTPSIQQSLVERTAFIFFQSIAPQKEYLPLRERSSFSVVSTPLNHHTRSLSEVEVTIICTTQQASASARTFAFAKVAEFLEANFQKLAGLFIQLNQLLQVYEPVFSSLLVLVEEDFRPLWELAGERGVACLVVEERLVASVALF